MAKTVTIKGLKSLEAKLKRLPPAAEKRIKEAMEKGAGEIVAMMKSLAPVDQGDLRDSIGWTWGDKPKYSQALAKVKSADGRLAITVYAGNSKVRYAHLVEFGAAPHIAGGMFEGAQHPGAPAQPFFYVSWRALRRRTKSRITRAITKSAKEVAAGKGA
ncbi:HK97-gp10 family putative phage morphogenesis protein [Nitratireductor kimnyeongensis]|uniref:HK97-gp10 family putative phage morphogenesis protein n=1 Tax=Nitratireductor kimnyeongensis TaxID=430679 RepID=A0ABW0T6B5_9HYPH|nr:HK97-gp10 family putative phage morphogenesis protein [Nitratireductor kimnyeongensis]QZZ34578.1 HK97 gp10 family phage protein [Nitratireductor kimnyeongensis]